MELIIRRVQRGDEHVLAYIQTESWKAAFAGILDPQTLARCTDIVRAEAMYRRLLENNVGSGYLLTLNSAPHAIAWWDAARGEDMPGYAEIICIHSLPANWHRGCGRRLMNTLLTDIAAAGYKKVMLWVFTENTRARQFYEAAGFHATNQTKDALGTKEIRYARSLETPIARL